jgi:hypothetical protein
LPVHPAVSVSLKQSSKRLVFSWNRIVGYKKTSRATLA